MKKIEKIKLECFEDFMLKKYKIKLHDNQKKFIADVFESEVENIFKAFGGKTMLYNCLKEFDTELNLNSKYRKKIYCEVKKW